MQKTSHPSRAYIGRYAPSPTGALHLGNLQTALLAWLHARLHGGTFLLRMEDLDTPRVVTGSAAQIVADLSWLGLDWDGPVIFQSERLALYDQAFAHLQQHNHVFPCFCSRKDIREAASAPHGSSPTYPGTCLNLSAQDCTERARSKSPAYRLRCAPSLGSAEDELDCFVVKRADGVYAYHLAVTVDDLVQGVTHVVRGADLHTSQTQQRYLAQLLEPHRAPLAYLSVPLKLDTAGQRMSKRDGSESAQQWIARGGTAADLVGKLAFEVGLIDAAKPLSAQELLKTIDLDCWQAAMTTYSPIRASAI